MLDRAHVKSMQRGTVRMMARWLLRETERMF